MSGMSMGFREAYIQCILVLSRGSLEIAQDQKSVIISFIFYVWRLLFIGVVFILSQKDIRQLRLKLTSYFLCCLVWDLVILSSVFIFQVFQYIYQLQILIQMAFELYGMLAGSVSPMTGETIKPAYGGEEEAFLRKVVTPIYNTIVEVFHVHCWPKCKILYSGCTLNLFSA